MFEVRAAVKKGDLNKIESKDNNCFTPLHYEFYYKEVFSLLNIWSYWLILKYVIRYQMYINTVPIKPSSFLFRQILFANLL